MYKVSDKTCNQVFYFLIDTLNGKIFLQYLAKFTLLFQQQTDPQNINIRSCKNKLKNFKVYFSKDTIDLTLLLSDPKISFLLIFLETILQACILFRTNDYSSFTNYILCNQRKVMNH